jgi:hypothetical protein
MWQNLEIRKATEGKSIETACSCWNDENVLKIKFWQLYKYTKNSVNRHNSINILKTAELYRNSMGELYGT